MSKQVQFFWAMTVQEGGSVQVAGSLDAPVKTVTIDALGRQRHVDDIPVPAGGSSVVYAYSADGPWDFFMVQIRGGEGFLLYTLGLDSPVSGSNPAASGSFPATTPKLGLSCTAPLVLNTRQCMVNGNATAGFIYTITLYNPGTSDLFARLWSH